MKICLFNLPHPLILQYHPLPIDRKKKDLAQQIFRAVYLTAGLPGQGIKIVVSDFVKLL